MNLEKRFNAILSELPEPFINKITQEFDVSYDQLKYTEFPKVRKCPYRFIRGKNKGGICNSPAYDNGYCGKHQKTALKFGGDFTVKKVDKNTPKQTPKSRQQILELLATAIPERKVILKKHNLGFLHEQTDIIFEKRDDDFIVVGVVNGKKLGKLTKLEIDICERMGWRYDYDMVEDSENNSDSSDNSSETEKKQISGKKIR